MHVQHLKYDVCVIGGGIAGLTLALSLPKSISVGVFSGSRVGMNASSYAQGGIASSEQAEESLDDFVGDILQSGGGIANVDKARLLAEQSESAVEWLIAQGVRFTKEFNNGFAFGHDGGHSNPRLVHNTNETGKHIMGALTHQLASHDNISMYYDSAFFDFVTEDGLPKSALFQREECHSLIKVHASQFVLATGGVSGIFLNSSNPDKIYGAGLVAAWACWMLVLPT